jgi:hypothetical protein
MTTENQNEINDIVEINLEKVEEKIENNKREVLKSEKVLLIIALAAAVLFDRLFLNVLMKQADNIFYFTAIFGICFIILYCGFNWEKIYKKPLLWIIAGLIILLCVWNLIFDYMSAYGLLTFLVIPATLMMFTQLAAENHNLKNIGGMILSWILGWIIKPFVAIHKCAGVFAAVFFPKNSAKNAIIIKILIALLITVPLVLILLALLSGADKVFGYYVNKIFASFHISDFILHFILIFIAFFLFYSFFWDSRFGKFINYTFNPDKKSYKADNLVIYIILGSVLVLYILFCLIQFAYLFASAGLPEGISYSEYAREGFAQIVVISGINLILFGFMLKFGKIHRQGEKDIVLKIMLYSLIGMTGIMLASGFMRLGLYINEFGMTFLRLISAWFMIYLVLVLILCAVRLIKVKLPLIALCAVLLLFSYNVLGYINPDSFIVEYNLSGKVETTDANQWVENNYSYAMYDLSDDALNVLLDKGLDKVEYAEMFKYRYSESVERRSVASMKLTAKLAEFAGD